MDGQGSALQQAIMQAAVFLVMSLFWFKLGSSKPVHALHVLNQNLNDDLAATAALTCRKHKLGQ